MKRISKILIFVGLIACSLNADVVETISKIELNGKTIIFCNLVHNYAPVYDLKDNEYKPAQIAKYQFQPFAAWIHALGKTPGKKSIYLEIRDAYKQDFIKDPLIQIYNDKPDKFFILKADDFWENFYFYYAAGYTQWNNFEIKNFDTRTLFYEGIFNGLGKFAECVAESPLRTRNMKKETNAKLAQFAESEYYKQFSSVEKSWFLDYQKYIDSVIDYFRKKNLGSKFNKVMEKIQSDLQEPIEKIFEYFQIEKSGNLLLENLYEEYKNIINKSPKKRTYLDIDYSNIEEDMNNYICIPMDLLAVEQILKDPNPFIIVHAGANHGYSMRRYLKALGGKHTSLDLCEDSKKIMDEHWIYNQIMSLI